MKRARSAKTKTASAAKRFVVRGECVTDRTTGLVWTRGNVGTERLTWNDAKAACAALRIGKHSDWRLPTLKELLTLADYERHSPAIDPVFKCDSSWYWTSTPVASSPADCAWSVYFFSGVAYWCYHDHESRVRAVRAGQ